MSVPGLYPAFSMADRINSMGSSFERRRGAKPPFHLPHWFWNPSPAALVSRLETFLRPARREPPNRCRARHDHEFLKAYVVACVRASVEHVQLWNRQNVFISGGKLLVKRDFLFGSHSFGGCYRNAQDGIGAQLGIFGVPRAQSDFHPVFSDRLHQSPSVQIE
jgi:hypothetical protein